MRRRRGQRRPRSDGAPPRRQASRDQLLDPPFVAPERPLATVLEAQGEAGEVAEAVVADAHHLAGELDGFPERLRSTKAVRHTVTVHIGRELERVRRAVNCRLAGPVAERCRAHARALTTEEVLAYALDDGVLKPVSRQTG